MQLRGGVCLLVLLLTTTGCLTSAKDEASAGGGSSSTSSATLSYASGVRGAKIIFKQANPGGSFNSPPVNGTTTGTGLNAVRVFYPDGTLMVDGSYASSTWPKWLKAVSIGISGVNNPTHSSSDCARFANAADTVAQCDFDANGASDKDCGAPLNLYRVSEVDCVNGATNTNGTGISSDGVFVRAEFSRDTAYLAAHENIMAVIEYSSAALNRAPANPTQCFTGGVFDPTNTNCSDTSWQIFLRSTLDATVFQPYLTLVPPALGYLDTTNNKGGSGVSTKQIYVPLATDAAVKYMQISRIKSIPSTTVITNGRTFNQICAANSASCVGMIFYSITFFRI